MSLPPPSDDPIPEDTRRVARAASPKGSLAMRLRDALGSVFHDGMFADLYSDYGRPATAPWRLALVTVLQYAEHLTDRQAAEAVRLRIDWKYALALPLDDVGFDASVLSTFRDRLVVGEAQERLLWAILEACRTQGWLPERGRQRTDSTHVLAAVRSLNRLELVGEMLRATLEVLAVVAADWLVEHLQPEWEERYARRVEEYRLPRGEAKRQALAVQIGTDGCQLLAAIDAPQSPGWLRELPMVQRLRRVWEQQYELRPTPPRFRATADLPAAGELISSPYDEEMHWGHKRELRWLGGKVHLTEWSEPDGPDVVVHVQTTAATTADQGMLACIWEDEEACGLLGSDHLVDAGYMTGAALVRAQQYGIELVGPVQQDSSWQRRAGGGYDQTHFQIDWAAQTVTCPQGKQSSRWREEVRRGRTAIQVHFRRADCQACPVREQCTTADRRSLGLLPRAQSTAWIRAREQQETASFRERYRQRAGIEGTISQAVRRLGLRQARYRGLTKLHLQHCATAAALNAIRITAYLADVPRPPTRRSHLTRLAAQRHHAHAA